MLRFPLLSIINPTILDSSMDKIPPGKIINPVDLHSNQNASVAFAATKKAWRSCINKIEPR